MRPVKHLRAISLLIALAIAPLALGSAYAHDGSADARTGLSEAARLASAAPSGVGPVGSLSGWFHIIFGDAPPGSSVPGISGYVLIDDQGQATELLVDEQALQALGGVRTINHQRVTVTGQAAAAPLTGVQLALPLLAVQALQPDGPQRTAAAVAAAQAVSGPQRWATILCRFADSTGLTPNPLSYFQSLMLGTTPPGLDHYWRELSFNNVNLVGSAVYGGPSSDINGWYNLPNPRSYYVGTPPTLQLDFQKAANDCTAVADPDVFFPDFVGINLMFNDNLDGFAWGGSWTLTRDGLTKTYRMTWVPPWGYENQGPIAHEMGHGFGLHHSSGPYSATYDSRWDVMSDIWDNCPPYDPTYGCVGPHTIAYHKDILGWIPSAQKYVAAPGTSQTIMMERLGQPTTSNYLMAQLPIGGSATQFYTVETRRFAGYDTKLPGEAVVLHRVDTTLSDRNAKVVDTDGNGNPNDAGAMWLPGESFVDSVNHFTVAVNAQLATGFQVTITNGVPSSFTLSVTVTGTGVVTSNPPGINSCSSGTCVANFASETSVTLTTSAGTLSAWSGACSGTGSCVVSMTQNQSVTATFGLPAVLTALTSNVTFPVPVGTPITWTATASGGIAPLQYRFWLYDGTTATWTIARDYAASNTFAWTPTAPGQYAFAVWVRSAGSTAAWEAGLNGPSFTISASAPVTVSTLTASVTFPVPVGTPITWTATASGGIAPLQYRFWRYDGTTATWTIARDYAASNTFTWTPTTPGQYTFAVWVRSAGSTAAWEAGLNTPSFTISAASAPVTVSALTASVTFPVPVGTPITWTATASGGTAPLQYRFWLYDGTTATWTVVRDYAASSTFAWTPTAPGQYAFAVWVRSAGSTAAWEAGWNGASFTVSASAAPVTVSALTASVTFPVPVGAPITWTATASGGTAPLQYRFWRYDGTTATWTIIRDYAAANTFAWTPTAPGQYAFAVWVRSAGSTAAWEAGLNGPTFTITSGP